MRKHKGNKAAMMGDGSNDAKALAMEDVYGVAPVHATNAAKDSAKNQLYDRNLYGAFDLIMPYFKKK
jgi:cation transport ATPase